MVFPLFICRYVCCDCGYVENWVENRHELTKIKDTFGYRFNKNLSSGL
jgi:hypothetical protein